MAASKLFLLLATVVAATTTTVSAVAAEAQMSAASGSGTSSNSIRPCDTDELVALGAIFKNTTRKAQCEESLKITEMMRPPGDDFQLLCGKPSCEIALNVFFNKMPKCQYQGWSPQEQADKILRFCGVTPRTDAQITALGTDQLDGGATNTTAPSPVATWSSPPNGTTTSFAPIGATPAPAATTAAATDATPTPSPTSAARASAPSGALVLAASLLATVAAFA